MIGCGPVEWEERMMKIFASSLVIAGDLLLTGMITAHAASFDCGKAKTPFEKTVCASPELSNADMALGKAFEAALVPLSEEGRSALREGQRAWLRFVTKVCRVTGKRVAKADDPSSPEQCLVREYWARVQSSAVTVADDVIIRRVDVFRAESTDETDTYYRGFRTTNIAYPQIDRPKTDDDRVWNKLMEDRAKKETAFNDPTYSVVSTDYTITLVTQDIVSLSIRDYSFFGGAHGSTAETPMVWLRRQRRFATIDDIFDRTTDWGRALAAECLRALDIDAKESGNVYEVKDVSTLQSAVIDPERWTVEARGLGTHFREYEIGPFASGNPVCVVPWSALKPYLAANPPFTIPRDETRK
jgi:uncharacterized protein